MNIFVKIIIAVLNITFATAIASTTTATAPNKNEKPLMVFQIIQNQLVFDSSMIDSATLIPPTNPSDPYGLQLKLKITAANELTRITGENIEKKMNIVFDGVVVSSPIIQSKLGAEFQITGLSKKQAEQFIKSLVLPK